jgi:hypothetical protein
LRFEFCVLTSRVRPVALRRSRFREVAASIRQKRTAASVAWQPCGEGKSQNAKVKTVERRTFCVLTFNFCLPRLGPIALRPRLSPGLPLSVHGPERTSSGPGQDTGMPPALLSTKSWKQRRRRGTERERRVSACLKSPRIKIRVCTRRNPPSWVGTTRTHEGGFRLVQTGVSTPEQRRCGFSDRP